MELKEIRTKKVDELVALEEKLRQDLSGLHLKKMTGNLTDTTSMRKVRKNIARVLTIKGEMLRKGEKV